MVRQRMAVGAAAILWSEFPATDVSAVQRLQSCAHSDDTPTASAAPGRSSRNLDDFDPRSRLGSLGRKVISVPKSLLDAVAGVLANPVEDLSNPVALVVREDPRRLAAEARRADYDPERARTVISLVQQQVREVQASFLNQQHRKSRWHHGLRRGQIDDRRLWKPLVGDPGYFKLKELAGRPSLAVGLLLDVSGSVSRYMTLVEQTTAVFCQGLLPIPGIDFAAWWYTGQSSKMILTGICERRYPKLCLANVAQGGGTPSGEAIAGVKVLMERMSGKQQLLIHFTDGRPDCPIYVRRAVQACRDAGIQVYAIGPSRYRELLASEYSTGNYETIEAVSELPEAVARLVKKLGVCQR